MGRPRIRTIKPEIWQHEKIGRVSRDERLLFIGLLTMVDDDGRMREIKHAIRGHVFPYDNVTDRQLEKWLHGLEHARLIVRYGVGRERFAALRGFNRHQVINRPRSSDLPPPPGIPGPEAQTSLLDEPKLTESSVEDQDQGTDHGSGIKERTPPLSPPTSGGAIDDDSWDRVLEHLAGAVPPMTVNAFRANLSVVGHEGGTLTLAASDDTVAGWTRNTFLREIEAAAAQVFGADTVVELAKSETEKARERKEQEKQMKAEMRARRPPGRRRGFGS